MFVSNAYINDSILATVFMWDTLLLTGGVLKLFLSMLLLIPMDIEYQYVTHPRPQGYPVFLNVIFPLTKWIGGSGDEDVCYPFR